MIPAGSIPAMHTAIAAAVVSSEVQSERKGNLKGRLPDSHEIAAVTVPVRQVSQVPYRGRLLAE